MVIDQNTALVVFVIIIIVALLIALSFGDYNCYDISWFHSFILILIGLGIFVTFLFYYALVSSDLQTTELQIFREISRLNNGITNALLDEIEKVSQVIPNFILSITPLSPAPLLQLDKDPVNINTHIAKMTLSTRIFMIWEYVLISKQLTRNDELSYISEFLQRANSTQLHDIWLTNKINYNQNTQVYGDLLFEYSSNIKEQQPDLYVEAAKQMCCDIRYKSCFD